MRKLTGSMENVSRPPGQFFGLFRRFFDNGNCACSIVGAGFAFCQEKVLCGQITEMGLCLCAVLHNPSRKLVPYKCQQTAQK